MYDARMHPKLFRKVHISSRTELSVGVRCPSAPPQPCHRRLCHSRLCHCCHPLTSPSPPPHSPIHLTRFGGSHVQRGVGQPRPSPPCAFRRQRHEDAVQAGALRDEVQKLWHPYETGKIVIDDPKKPGKVRSPTTHCEPEPDSPLPYPYPYALGAAPAWRPQMAPTPLHAHPAICVDPRHCAYIGYHMSDQPRMLPPPLHNPHGPLLSLHSRSSPGRGFE